ncbi:unnamed protein product [Rodentolepis nana]|uniref:BTB domain-containing protein n=1 Tax=Rodentolepis nana TaxID=102285 RepID=A0A0R3T4E4_RODNA|nr:unnamed protein product [Rodentolepis nana]
MEEKIYTNVDTISIPVKLFQSLRKKGKFLDGVIITKDKREIPVHRIVLCTQFPSIEDKFTEDSNNRIEWIRFTFDIVKAVVDYAYTGSVNLTLENATNLYLLSLTIGCRKLIQWCNDFIKSSISYQNLEQIWTIANATSNKGLATACIPLMANTFESLNINQRLLIFTEVENMLELLKEVQHSEITEEEKLRTIVSWINAPNKKVERDERAAYFEELFSAIDLDNLSGHFIVELATEELNIGLSDKLKRSIIDGWKTSRKNSDSGISNVSDASVERITSSISEKLLVHALDEDSEYGILAAVPHIQTTANSRYCVPYRTNSCVVALKGDVYLIGGRDSEKNSVNQVQRVNSYNGRVFNVAPMKKARSGASAVVSNNCIFIFGGYDGSRKMILGSCEKYDPTTDRWSSLPPMPTARYGTGAVHIPDFGELVLGGCEKRGKLAPNLTTVELLLNDASENEEYNGTWHTIAPMLKPRIWPAAVYFKGDVYVARDGDDTVEKLTMSTGQWTLISEDPEIDSFPYSMAVFDRRLLLSTDCGKIYELKRPDEDEEEDSTELVWDQICEIENVQRAKLLVIK